MGLFDIFKKKETKKEEVKENHMLLAMPMFRNGDNYNLEKVLGHLRIHWGLTATTDSHDAGTSILTISDQTVIIAAMDVPILWGDIESAADYAFLWRSAAEELKPHTSHAIVTIMSGGGTQLDKALVLTKVLSSILATSDAIGVYQGSQTLLTSKDQYLKSADTITEGSLPISLWIYIGLRKRSGGSCAYTYGMFLFGKTEMEVLDTDLEMGDLYMFLYSTTEYVIKGNITLHDGETIGMSMTQKIRIKLSKGAQVKGDTLKLEYTPDNKTLTNLDQMNDEYIAGNPIPKSDEDAMMRQASKYLTSGKYAESLALYKQLAASFPDQRDMYESQVGVCYFYMGDMDRAVDHYVIAMEHGFDREMSEDNIYEAAAALYSVVTLNPDGSVLKEQSRLLEKYAALFPKGKYLEN